MTTATGQGSAAMTGSLRGGPREVIALAYPVVLTQVSQTAMGVVDSAMVGRLGPTELAAVGFGGVWLWTLFSLLYGVASGVQTFVSQADGAGRQPVCGAWAWQGAYVVLPFSIALVCVLYAVAPPLIDALGASAELAGGATAYVHARLPGEVGLAIAMVLTSFFRGFGDTKTPLYVTLAANALNAALDYGLIFGALGLPRLGIVGAGLASSVAEWAMALALFGLFFGRALRERYRTQPVRPDFVAMRRFARIGIPIGGQWFVGMAAFAAFTTVVARMGDTSMAASQAFVMLLSMSFMQAVGIGIACSTLVGRYVGARDLEAAERSFRSSLGLGFGLAAIVAVLFVLAPGALLGIFTSDTEVRSLGRPLLMLGALFQLFDAVAIIASGALRGAGDTRWPFLAETASSWGVFLPLAYLFGVGLDGGLTAAWCGGAIHVFLISTLFVLRFRSGAWRKLEIGAAT